VEKRRLCVCFLFFERRLWNSVVTLAITGNTISSRVVWRQWVLVSREHRLFQTGSQWNIRWLSGRGKTPTSCVVPAFSAAFMEKCCDACGDGEYYFRSSCLASEGADVSRVSTAVDRKSLGHTVAERSRKDTDFLCIPSNWCGGYGEVL
jgi:hypothetical protein